MGDYSLGSVTPLGPIDQATSVEVHSDEQVKLRNACRDMEGMFLSLLLKEGLKMEPAEGEESGTAAGGSLYEAAVEQVAQDMGRTGGMGIGDAFYDTIQGRFTPPRGIR